LDKENKVTGHTKIRELKRIIADRVGSIPQELRFISGALELIDNEENDDKTLFDLDIGDLSWISLVLRVKGGKKFSIIIKLHDLSKITIDCDSTDSIL
jgi:hypothetical protein